MFAHLIYIIYNFVESYKECKVFKSNYRQKQIVMFPPQIERRKSLAMNMLVSREPIAYP